MSILCNTAVPSNLKEFGIMSVFEKNIPGLYRSLKQYGSLSVSHRCVGPLVEKSGSTSCVLSVCVHSYLSFPSHVCSSIQTLTLIVHHPFHHSFCHTCANTVSIFMSSFLCIVSLTVSLFYPKIIQNVKAHVSGLLSHKA